MLKKEGNLNDFESKYKDSISKKTKMIHTFTTRKLEDLLSSSTKNVAQEVVNCLIPQSQIGILLELESQTGSNMNSTQNGFQKY